MYGFNHLNKYGNDLSYILGVLYGDGTARKERINNKGKGPTTKQFSNTCCIELKVIDKEFIKEFAFRLIRFLKRPDSRKPRKIFKCKNQNIYRVCVRAKKFGEWYLDNTIDKKKFILNEPEHFLKGIYDSEGNFSYSGYKKNPQYQVRIFNTDTEIIKLISLCLEKLNITHHIRVFREEGEKTNKSNNCKRLFVVQMNSKNAKKFIKIVGSSIPRKRGEGGKK